MFESLPAPAAVKPFSRAQARWTHKQPSPEIVETLASTLDVPRLVAAVLAARGYANCEIALAFLRPDLTALHDPFLLRDMDKAVDRIWKAIRDKQPVLLYGDYDVDGTSSIVVLKKAIELLGGQVDFHVPHRLNEGYGMRSGIIDTAAARGVRLVISVDCGIRSQAVVEHANGLGLDVIVTDHHLPEADLPPALAVLNPNRPDCAYPNKHLCGAGVAFKLVQALLTQSELPAARCHALLESFLKPVAIATVADIVPLTGENRVIVQRGLSGLKQVRNVGLRSLMRVAGFDDGDCPTAHQVAFRIAPRINAAGRMASARDVIELFLTDDTDRARQLAEQLDQLNRERQQVEAEIVEHIVRECETREPVELSRALVFAGTGWHLGVLGIVASRLVERFSRPVFVLSDAVSQTETGCLSGSGRSIPAFHLLAALESMPDLFTRFGGHKQAAGVTLAAHYLPDFQARLAAFAAQQLSPEDLCPEYLVDAEASLSDLNDHLVSAILSLGPFGFGNPSPIFLARGAEVAGPPKLLKEGKHCSVPLRHNGRTLFCNGWNFAHRMDLLQRGAHLDALFQIEDDPGSRKRGYGAWSICLKDVRAAQ